MSESSPRDGPSIVELVDRFLECHRRASSALVSGQAAAAAELVGLSGLDMILCRRGVALVPFDDHRGKGLDVRRYRDLDLEDFHDREGEGEGEGERIAERDVRSA
jgi:hypothetical protein